MSSKKLMFPPKKTDIVTYDFTEAELQDHLGDVRWRLNHLYPIKDAKNRVCIFTENEAQTYLFNNMHTRNAILKCRKLGFSTAIQVLMLDTALWAENQSCKVIAQDLQLAEGIFRDVLKFAYDNMPEPLKMALVPKADPSKSAMEFMNGSRIEVSSSTRGMTPTFLHVSELARIAKADPVKSYEIITGALTSVAEDGLIFVESTASGAEGDFFDLIQTALRLQESKTELWKLHYKLFFFPWMDNPNYVAPADAVTITKKDTEYFDDLELVTLRRITPEQRAWYVLYRDNTYAGSDEKMWAEMPSTVDEAFKISTEGAYFKDQFTILRKNQQIGFVPYDPQYPVSLFFDTGRVDYTSIWFIQPKRTHFAVINYIEECGEPFVYFALEVEKLNYVLGYVYVPHDAEHTRQGAVKNQSNIDLIQQVAPHWRIWPIPRTPDKQMTIQQARNVLVQCVFDEANCSVGLKHLQNYRKQWNKRTGRFSDTPRHDKASNAADAFQCFAQAKAIGAFSEVGDILGGPLGFEDSSYEPASLDYI